MSQRRNKRKSDSYNKQSFEETFEDVADSDEIVNNVVRYIIFRGGEHVSFTKSELTRNVIFKAGGSKYEEILKRVQAILREIYGYNLMVCNSTKGKDKQYVVSNILPYINDPSEDPQEVPEDVHKVLLLLILSHILMSNNKVSDVSLYSFLNYFQIDVEQKHPIFGQVKEYINKVLTKKQYLVAEIDKISKRQTFKWGVRAEKEISKKEILKFVCKMYRDRQPKDWVQQYQDANEQAFGNHLESGSVPTEQETSE